MKLNPLSPKFFIIYGLIALIIIPLFHPNPYILHILILAFIYSMTATSWDLLRGYGGQLAFGWGAFFGVGGYAAAIWSLPIEYKFTYGSGIIPIIRLGQNPWLGLLVGGVISAILGTVISFPSLRLRGLYLALCTLAFSQVMYIFATNLVPLTEGPSGLMGFNQLFGSYTQLATYDLITNYFYLGLIFMVVVAIILYYIAEHTSLGLSFKAIRDDDVLAESVGLNVTRTKILLFVISTFFTGFSGGFYAYYMRMVNPSLITLTFTSMSIAMVLIGGLGTIVGPVIGSIIVTVLNEGLRAIGAVVNLIALGIIIILCILIIPDGIVGLIKKISK